MQLFGERCRSSQTSFKYDVYYGVEALPYPDAESSASIALQYLS
jgi:hypothetical protein